MSEPRDEPLTGEVYDAGGVKIYGWEWNDIGGPRSRSRLPWFGIFLVVFGALLLLRQLFPALETAGSPAVPRGRRRVPGVVAGQPRARLALPRSDITALAAPDLLAAANVVSGPGVGTLCLGIAFLFIALVRGMSGAGWGWQLVLGVILFAIGVSSVALPNVSDIVWPVTLLVLGVIVLVRAMTPKRP